jgi:hypothetical protein
VDPNVVRSAALELVEATAEIARYCDHVDHVELAEVQSVLEAAASIRSSASVLAGASGQRLQQAWADRLAAFESRHPVLEPSEAPESIRVSRTWRELQLAQYGHDAIFHPDILGLTRHDQLVHAVVHLVKAQGALCRSLRAPDPAENVAIHAVDCAVFGVKIATLCGERLTDSDGPGPGIPPIV